MKITPEEFIDRLIILYDSNEIDKDCLPNKDGSGINPRYMGDYYDENSEQVSCEITRGVCEAMCLTFNFGIVSASVLFKKLYLLTTGKEAKSSAGRYQWPLRHLVSLKVRREFLRKAKVALQDPEKRKKFEQDIIDLVSPKLEI